jgi:flagellar basal-body rod modification protein FlgD
MPQQLSSVTQSLFDEYAPQHAAKQPTKQLGKEDFLKLLTLQLRSQNPLDPASNQEMAAQLAQFSALEQMQNISSTLEQLLQSNASLALSIAQYSAPSLIGKTATVSSPQLQFDGNAPVSIGYRLAASASRATIEIRSESGAVIRTIEIPPSALSSGVHSIEWDGRDNRGAMVPAGRYTYVVRATDASGAELTAEPQVRGRITGVRYTSSGLVVLLGALEVPIGSILELSS